MKVEKNGVVMVIRDKNQLAAFENNGWKKVADEESLTTKTKKTTEK